MKSKYVRKRNRRTEKRRQLESLKGFVFSDQGGNKVNAAQYVQLSVIFPIANSGARVVRELKEPRVFKLGQFVQLTATIPVPVTLARVTRLLKEPSVVKVVQFVQFRDTVATPPDENRSVANTGKEPSVVKAVQFVQEIRMPVVAVKLGVVRHRSQFRKCPQVVNSGPQLVHVTLIKLAKVVIVSL